MTILRTGKDAEEAEGFHTAKGEHDMAQLSGKESDNFLESQTYSPHNPEISLLPTQAK